jgi:hypothetical protein
MDVYSPSHMVKIDPPPGLDLYFMVERNPQGMAMSKI